MGLRETILSEQTKASGFVPWKNVVPCIKVDISVKGSDFREMMIQP